MHLLSHMRVDPTSVRSTLSCGIHPHVRGKMHALETPCIFSLQSRSVYSPNNVYWSDNVFKWLFINKPLIEWILMYKTITHIINILYRIEFYGCNVTFQEYSLCIFGGFLFFGGGGGGSLKDDHVFRFHCCRILLLALSLKWYSLYE